jgi:hypothetical protein
VAAEARLGREAGRRTITALLAARNASADQLTQHAV